MQAAAVPLNPWLDINFNETEHDVFTFGAVSQRIDEKIQIKDSEIKLS
jgi:hypothetical protein